MACLARCWHLQVRERKRKHVTVVKSTFSFTPGPLLKIDPVRVRARAPVVSSFDAEVLRPLREHFGGVDTFVVLTLDQHETNGNFTSEDARIANAYSPVSLRRYQIPEPNCSVAGIKELRQFATIRECFNDVTSVERSRGVEYAWLLRFRTDIVHFHTAVPLLASMTAADAAQHTFVPAGGMVNAADFKCATRPSADLRPVPRQCDILRSETTVPFVCVRIRCMNDHMFWCPRPLCAPYFRDAYTELSRPGCATNAPQISINGSLIEHGKSLQVN
jgi:hypothetical protein